jgi:hypothetical protein
MSVISHNVCVKIHKCYLNYPLKVGINFALYLYTKLYLEELCLDGESTGWNLQAIFLGEQTKEEHG